MAILVRPIMQRGALAVFSASLIACTAAAPIQQTPPVTPAAPAAASSTEAVQLPEHNRPLTAGEIELLQPIFRDGIDYQKVRVVDGKFPFQPYGRYMTPNGHLYAPGYLWSDDFSRQPSRRATFVHEMAHVW